MGLCERETYPSRTAAKSAAHAEGGHAYQCNDCGYWHVGATPVVPCHRCRQPVTFGVSGINRNVIPLDPVTRQPHEHAA